MLCLKSVPSMEPERIPRVCPEKPQSESGMPCCGGRVHDHARYPCRRFRFPNNRVGFAARWTDYAGKAADGDHASPRTAL